MRHFALFAALSLPVCFSAHAATPADCPYTAEYLSQQLGLELKIVTRAAGLLGKACEYANKDQSIKIAVDSGPNPAPSPDMWLKMANPGGTKWTNVSNDPDKAVTLESYPNGAPYPALFYARKGHLTNISVLGPSGKSTVSQWNAKLVKLSRLPQ